MCAHLCLCLYVLVCVHIRGHVLFASKRWFSFCNPHVAFRMPWLLQAGSQIFTVISERFIFYPKSRQAGTDPFVCQPSWQWHSKNIHQWKHCFLSWSSFSPLNETFNSHTHVICWRAHYCKYCFLTAYSWGWIYLCSLTFRGGPHNMTASTTPQQQEYCLNLVCMYHNIADLMVYAMFVDFLIIISLESFIWTTELCFTMTQSYILMMPQKRNVTKKMDLW